MRETDIFVYDHRHIIGSGSCLSRVRKAKNSWVIETNREDIDKILERLKDIKGIGNAACYVVSNADRNRLAIRFESGMSGKDLAWQVARVLETDYDEVDWAPVEYARPD